MHRGASWASGAAQAAQFVRIILRFAVLYSGLRAAFQALRLGLKNPFFQPLSTRARDTVTEISRYHQDAVAAHPPL